jgi:hypothetical protein
MGRRRSKGVRRVRSGCRLDEGRSRLDQHLPSTGLRRGGTSLRELGRERRGASYCYRGAHSPCMRCPFRSNSNSSSSSRRWWLCHLHRWQVVIEAKDRIGGSRARSSRRSITRRSSGYCSSERLLQPCRRSSGSRLDAHCRRRQASQPSQKSGRNPRLCVTQTQAGVPAKRLIYGIQRLYSKTAK